MTPVYQKIIEKLNAGGVQFEVKHHAPTYTSQDAVEIVGEPMERGAKAIVMRGKKTHSNWLFVIRADKKIDAVKVKEIVGERVSFEPNVETVTGCVSGSVPPLGSVLGLKTYCDESLSTQDIISFNAGSLTDTVAMKYEDYIHIEQPEITNIALA